MTREQLRQALWTADTFVDFDRGLNAAMAKLRQALGDSADNPRFIETQARRGYRFIAPVECNRSANGAFARVEAAPEAVAQAAPAIARKKWTAFLPYGVSVITIAVVALWLWNNSPPGKTELVQLTEDTGLSTDPAVSPDGKLLVYASDRGSNGNLNIWIQQLGTGGAAVQLTRDSVDASEPAFSPDGTRIAFCSKRDGGGIYTVPVIGGEPTRLTQSGRHPRFSPDGRWISYLFVATDSVADAVGAVYVMPSSGGEARRVGPDLLAGASPVWSPDNEHLLVYLGPQHGYTWDEADWWTISLDGTPAQRTGAFKELRRQGFSLGFDRVPQASQWAKDFITFHAAFGDAVNAFRAPMSREGRITGAAVRLTGGTTTEISPRATPSGDLIFASLNRSLAVWSLSADPDRAKVASEVKRITPNATAVQPSISADGRMLAFTAARKRTRGGLDRPVTLTEDAAELRIEIKDLSTGKETFLDTRDTAQWRPANFA